MDNSPIGIDTIKVEFRVPKEKISFVRWICHESKIILSTGEKTIKKEYELHHHTVNGTIITLTYIPLDYSGNPNLLLIEFSLPKLIQGYNYHNITDYSAAFDYANAAIANIEGLPPLPDIRGGVLQRIDICANHQVGDDVSDYLQAIPHAYYPHRELYPYRGTGSLYKSDQISTTFYDKEKECKNPDAHGILRHEISIRNKRKIGKIFGKKNIKLGEITLEKLSLLINNDLQILHLDKPLVCDQTQMQEILSKVYTRRTTQLLLGYCLIRQTNTREQMYAKGYTIKNITDYELQLAEAGVSSITIQSKKTLPALSIQRDEEQIIFTDNTSIRYEVPSDTRWTDDLVQHSVDLDNLVENYLLNKVKFVFPGSTDDRFIWISTNQVDQNTS